MTTIPNLPGGIDSRELAVMRKQTLKFIQENPTTVVIIRTVRVPNGTGGFTTTSSNLDPQEFRKVIQGGNVASRNVDGEQIQPSYVFIGLYDADIKHGDKFVLDNRNYEVMFVRDDRRYETWAEVMYRG